MYKVGGIFYIVLKIESVLFSMALLIAGIVLNVMHTGALKYLNDRIEYHFLDNKMIIIIESVCKGSMRNN